MYRPLFAITIALLAAPAPLAARPVIFLGPADDTAIDQPKVFVEFLDSEGGSLGPNGTNFFGLPLNTFLLDTAAERILVFGQAVTDMQSAGLVTGGTLIEQGIDGFTEFDVTASYRVDFTGVRDGPVAPEDIVSVEGIRAIVDADNTNFDQTGPHGIIGMPGMAGRVTSLDHTPFEGGQFGPMGVSFADVLPDGAGHRYHVPLQLVDFPLEEPDPPSTSTGIPFLTAVIGGALRKRSGRFAVDTGAVTSIISEHFAFALGLDTDGDGNFDNEAIDNRQFLGVGGPVTVPVIALGDVILPTTEGTDLVWTGAVAAVLEIDPAIDGVFAFDWLFSGWIDEIFGGDRVGYFRKHHFDFLEAADHRGTLVLDLTAALDTPAPGLPPADLDGDRVADDWECLFFDDLDSPTGDIDFDGLSLLLEHALNLDPTVPDFRPLAVGLLPDGSIELTHRRNRELPFAGLSVECSPSLSEPSWVPVVPQSTSTVLFDGLTELVTLTLAPAAGDRFYRLRAE